MGAIERMRESFDECTVMAGVEPDFECVYITKAAALLLLKEVEQEQEKLRDLVRAAWKCTKTGLSCSDCRMIAGGCTLQSAMRELGIEVK